MVCVHRRVACTSNLLWGEAVKCGHQWLGFGHGHRSARTLLAGKPRQHWCHPAWHSEPDDPKRIRICLARTQLCSVPESPCLQKRWYAGACPEWPSLATASWAGKRQLQGQPDGHHQVSPRSMAKRRDSKPFHFADPHRSRSDARNNSSHTKRLAAATGLQSASCSHRCQKPPSWPRRSRSRRRQCRRTTQIQVWPISSLLRSGRSVPGSASAHLARLGRELRRLRPWNEPRSRGPLRRSTTESQRRAPQPAGAPRGRPTRRRPARPRAGRWSMLKRKIDVGSLGNRLHSPFGSWNCRSVLDESCVIWPPFALQFVHLWWIFLLHQRKHRSLWMLSRSCHLSHCTSRKRHAAHAAALRGSLRKSGWSYNWQWDRSLPTCHRFQHSPQSQLSSHSWLCKLLMLTVARVDLSPLRHHMARRKSASWQGPKFFFRTTFAVDQFNHDCNMSKLDGSTFLFQSWTVLGRWKIFSEYFGLGMLTLLCFHLGQRSQARTSVASHWGFLYGTGAVCRFSARPPFSTRMQTCLEHVKTWCQLWQLTPSPSFSNNGMHE